MKLIQKLFKNLILFLFVFALGLSIVAVFFIRDNSSNLNYRDLLNLNSQTQNAIEQNVEDKVTKRVVVLEENAVIDVIEKSQPAVVSIVSDRVALDPFEGFVQRQSGIGTGFLVEGGLVFTNRHVVDADLQYQVVLNDGTSFEVTQINKDPVNDFAILKIDSGNETLPFLQLGDSDTIKVGQTVIAIGNALGEFNNTASKGIISGINRQIVAGGFFNEPTEVIDNVIQTDAALNPGNSGGPLLDLDGSVIGINVARAGDSDNIGFSIPVNSIKAVYESFNELGEIQRPFLGINYYGDMEGGAIVQSVYPQTTADTMGIEPGDIILEIDGEEVSADNPLSKIILNKKVGDEVTITVYRDRREVDLKGTLQQAPDDLF